LSIEFCSFKQSSSLNRMLVVAGTPPPPPALASSLPLFPRKVNTALALASIAEAVEDASSPPAFSRICLCVSEKKEVCPHTVRGKKSNHRSVVKVRQRKRRARERYRNKKKKRTLCTCAFDAIGTSTRHSRPSITFVSLLLVSFIFNEEFFPTQKTCVRENKIRTLTSGLYLSF